MNQQANIEDSEAPPADLGLISVVIPAYNEEAAIGHDLRTIFDTMDASGYTYEVLVVDDGSTDATAAIVAEYPRARLVQHPLNLGVGAARTTGMRQAGGDIIVTTDGDGTYPNQQIPRLLALLQDNHMVVGARVREMGTLRWLRGAVKGGIQLLASYLAGRSIPDLNSGLRCYRKAIAAQFIPRFPQGHSWESTITLCFLTAGYRVAFLPVEYYPRLGGRSSFHPLRDTLIYLRLVVKTVFYFNPLKFLAPLSLALLLMGALAFAVQLGLASLFITLGLATGVLGLVAERRVHHRVHPSNITEPAPAKSVTE